MNLMDLSYFDKLSELKSFSKTAKYFEVSQPTITYAIKRLEKEFNTQLLIRDSKSHTVVLSPNGSQLLIHIKKILFEIEVSKQDIIQSKISKLKVGLPPIITNYFSSLFNILFTNNLLKNIEGITAESQVLMNELVNGKIDITLIGSLVPINKTNLETILLRTHKFKIISAKENILSKEKDISLFEIKDFPLILLDEKSVHNKAITRLASSINLTLNPIFKTSDYKLALDLIKNNQGIGFFTETAITNSLDYNVYDIKEASNLNFYIYLAYRKDKLLTSDMKKFISMVKNENN
ncbi:LysR family transcriptional regulator [Companilactobacillus sp. DQM5]|uniref:LysR family transcriptional regulator n=1 Tax=Companilactobacillus sp. DQM5 TaxID=3463359 RepID=UPI004058CD04